MQTIKIIDKHFELFITAGKIQEEIERVATKIIKENIKANPLFIVILNGSFMFAADLFKKVNIDCEISFVKYSSYKGTSSQLNVKKLIGINEEVTGRNIIIVEDIVDSGITIDGLLKELNNFKPESIKVATLLFKPDAFIKNFKIDYKCFEIPDEFVVGYGLDYNGKGRNFPDIYKIKNTKL